MKITKTILFGRLRKNTSSIGHRRVFFSGKNFYIWKIYKAISNSKRKGRSSISSGRIFRTKINRS